MAVNTKDIGAGATFLIIAGIYGGTALGTLSLGTITNMGPAYFPLILCMILALLGIVLVGRGLLARSRIRPEGHVAWRGILMITPATIFFAAFIREIGFAPAVAAVTFVTALASEETTPREALALAVAATTICVGIFIFGVRLPIPVFGTWLGG